MGLLKEGVKGVTASDTRLRDWRILVGSSVVNELEGAVHSTSVHLKSDHLSVKMGIWSVEEFGGIISSAIDSHQIIVSLI